MILKAADPKHNRYTIEVIADDKRVEKKDRTINEPVQFLLSRASLPYQLVVNDIKKDMITGYVAAPKVQQPRGSQEIPQPLATRVSRIRISEPRPSGSRSRCRRTRRTP